MKIIVAEDHLMFREVIVKACREHGHEIVGETSSGIEAIALCTRLRPAVLLLDMQLQKANGGDVLEALEAKRSTTKVIIVSGYLEEYLVFRIKQSIAWGFVDKSTRSVGAIGTALDAAAKGRKWFSPAFHEAHRKRRDDPNSFDKLLTERDQTFLRFVVHGLADAEIAPHLGISLRTAEGRRSQLLHLLGIENTPKLIAYGRKKGFDLFPLPLPKGIERLIPSWARRASAAFQQVVASKGGAAVDAGGMMQMKTDKSAER